MKLKRWLSALLALAVVICLFPVATGAAGATVEYILDPGKTYRLTNNDPDKDYEVQVTTGGVHYDKAEYRNNGEVSYAKNTFSWFKVNKGGYTDITGTEGTGTIYMPSEWSEFITVTGIERPALSSFTLEDGASYRLTNTDPEKSYEVQVTTGGVHYDKAEYRNNGEVSYAKNTFSWFKVNKGGYTDITGTEGTGTIYMPSEWNEFIKMTGIERPALSSFTLEDGASYRLTNTDPEKSYEVQVTTGGVHYDKAEYRNNGEVSYAKNTFSWFKVNKGGYTDITGTEGTGTIYMPSEWNRIITVMDENGNVLNKAEGQPLLQTPAQTFEHVYDIVDPGESVTLNTSRLDAVTDSASASSAVQTQTQSMTAEQKQSATGTDLATLYAETAVAKAASKAVSGSEIIINKAAVSDLEAVAAQTSAAVETALVNGGVSTARLVSNTVTLTTDSTGEITIKIDPDILETQVDKIRVETPTYALTLKVSDLAPDLTEILTITAQDVGSGYAPGNKSGKTTVKVNLPKGKTSNPVTVSLPKDSGDTAYQAVVKTDGSTTSSKYNPATTTMDGKVNTSGSYTVQTSQKDFTDIANKSAEMQKAIRYMASKGIINGTSDTTFSPDSSIGRAEIAALLVRALGKMDSGATNTFTDVKSSDWYYAAAGSSQKAGLINGYPDNTFRGTTTIAKDQILAVAARILKNEMGYKTPGNPAGYLGKYSDGVAAWAQPEVALATKENLVVYRVDGTFKGTGNMTRGDAAIIIYRLFQKIW